MKRSRRPLRVIAVLVAVLAVGVLLNLRSMKRSGFLRPAPPPETYGVLPDFTLTERSGRAVRLADLKGRPWVADFIFTRCKGPCPLLSAEMMELQRRLRGRPVRLVSFSVDPEHDTPAVLQSYAARFGADPDQWLFLTGDSEAVRRVVRDGFRTALEKSAADDFTHSTKFVLVDGDGRIRGYYDGLDPAELERIEKHIEGLHG